MALVQAEANVTFALQSLIPLLIESDGGLAVGGAYRLRLYPDVKAQVYADRGTAQLTTESTIINRDKEGVLFSGSNAARTKYPVRDLLGIEFIGDLTTIGSEGYELATVSASDFYVGVDGTIRAPIPLLGPVNVSYTTDYRIIEYTPLTSVNLRGTNILFQTGTVFAHYLGQTAQYVVQLRPLARIGSAEFFVAVSDVVIDRQINGWEKPPNWPDSADYPQLFPEGVPDINNSATKQRVHAIGIYDVIGSVSITWRTVKLFKPYKRSLTFKPQIRAIFAETPEPGLERGFERAVAQKDDVLERLDARYDNFIGEVAE